MQELNFIIPGHYVNKYSLDSDKKEYIRVLGEDPDRPDYFFIMNRKDSVAEHHILENYLFCPTEATSFGNEKSNNIKLGDIENIKVVEQPESQNYDTESFVNQQQEYVQQPIKQVKESKSQISEEEILLRRTIESVKTKEVKTFNLNLEIKSNYDIEKLIQISNLLNLDVTKIMEIIVKESLNSQIVNNLINYDFSKKEDVVYKETKPIIVEKTKPIIVEEPVEILTKVKQESDELNRNINDDLEHQNNRIKNYLNNQII